MVAPVPTKLDMPQVLNRVFDEDNGLLRTSAVATIVNADIDVALDATEDNIAIRDADGNELNINPDGSINVAISGTTGIISSKYTEVLGVATGVTTLIGTYTAVANDFLQKIAYSGTNVAEYELVIDGLTVDKKRTGFLTLNGTFDFKDGLGVPLGDVIQVYVVHDRPTVGDFNTRIQTMEM